MKDFENKEIEVGDEVVFIYDKFGPNELKRGIVKRTNIKQAKYTMALVEFPNVNNILIEARVSEHKIFVLRS